MSLMVRRFLPVGQGAFYTEQFHDINGKTNIVYDCGSKTKKPGSKKTTDLINSEISANFSKDEVIKMVFISHLHEDHVNGLEYLLKHCKVENVILPLTSKVVRSVLKLQYLSGNNNPSPNDFTYRFIDNPYETINELSRDTQIYPIMPVPTDEDNNNAQEPDNSFANSFNIHIQNSGANIFSSILGKNTQISLAWEYVPFNFEFKANHILVARELSKCLSQVNTSYGSWSVDDIIDNWGDPKIQQAVKQAFVNVYSNRYLNSSSMTLFSGTLDDSVSQRVISCSSNSTNKRCICPGLFYKNGCLFTGDYDANANKKWDKLYEAYKNYWDHIGCLQLPHHGSYHNYNHAFTGFNAYFVISAGKHNSYRHPHASVLKDLVVNNKCFYLVNEGSVSTVISEIS